VLRAPLFYSQRLIGIEAVRKNSHEIIQFWISTARLPLGDKLASLLILIFHDIACLICAMKIIHSHSVGYAT